MKSILLLSLAFALFLHAEAASKKRGLGYPWDASFKPSMFGNKQVSWLYNWEAWKPANVPKNLEYVAMVRTAADGPALDGFMKNNGAKVLMCLNEPDQVGQADLTVKQSVDFFKKHCQKYANKGLKVIAPAVTNGRDPMGFTFLDDFLKKCTGCKIQGVNIHWYGTSLTAFKSHINEAIAKYGSKYEIWVTEYGIAEGKLSENFLRKAAAFLDSKKQVTRHAYFGAFEGNMVVKGKLSKLGKAYSA